MNKNPRILLKERLFVKDWAGAQRLLRNKKHWFYLTGDSRQLKYVGYADLTNLFPYSVDTRYTISTEDWIKQNLTSIWAVFATASYGVPIIRTYYFLDEKDFIYFKMRFG